MSKNFRKYRVSVSGGERIIFKNSLRDAMNSAVCLAKRTQQETYVFVRTVYGLCADCKVLPNGSVLRDKRTLYEATSQRVSLARAPKIPEFNNGELRIGG